MPSTSASRLRLSARSGARCVHCTSIGSVALTCPSSLVPLPSTYPAVPPPGNTLYVPASMESLGLRLLAVVALVLANAFFVAAEFALVAARRTRIEAMVRRGDRKARTVQAALQDLYRQLSAEQLHSPEELRMLVEQSRKRGKLDADDARLLQGVFEFSEKTAREVMTPRTEMVALPADLTLEQAADQVAVAGRSRYPVYAESLDDILGVVHAKDILAGLRSAKGGTVRTVLRPAMFVPGTREVEDVLADMKRQKIHLAIVLDEFGGTAGLVTMEDLLEEIVGPIYDEYDQPSGELRIAPAGAAPVISGATPLRDVNRVFGLELDEQDYTTIGGFLFGAIGRLPKVGDQVAVKGAMFEILEMEGRRVGKVRVVRRTVSAETPSR